MKCHISISISNKINAFAFSQISRQTNDALINIIKISINLRSGPGTGYSITGYGFRGDQLQVGGTNTDGSWLLVGTQDSSAWMSGSTGTLNGSCSNLAVYDIPYRDAPAPQVSIVTPNSGFGGGEHEGGEHEDGEFEDD